MDNLDFSKEKSISNLINSYINPINPIYKITYLKTDGYISPINDKDGYTGDDEPRIIQNIPISIFLKWKKDKLIKNKCKSFYLINYCDFFKSDFYISNHKNNNIKNILKNINIIGYPNSIYKIKYQIKDQDIILQENEFILETDRSEVIFKSYIKNKHHEKSCKDRFLILKDQVNSGKIIENNPINYIYSCIKNGKISLQFLLFWIDKKIITNNHGNNKTNNLTLLNYELLV